MIYQEILDSLLAGHPEYQGAALLDEEGEAIVAAHRDGQDHDVRVLGAYQGIYLRALSRISRGAGLGDVREFEIRRAGGHILTRVLPGGYYVVLETSLGVPASWASRNLAAACLKFAQVL